MSAINNKRPPAKVPSVSEYVSAFRQIEHKLTKKHKAMLELHYKSYCHVTTATDMAIAMKYKDFRGANGQYGGLGSMVSETMGLGRLGVITLTLMVPANTVGNPEWLWVMRDNVVKALEQLGWVEKTSHLFYPNGLVGTEMDVS